MQADLLRGIWSADSCHCDEHMIARPDLLCNRSVGWLERQQFELAAELETGGLGASILHCMIVSSAITLQTLFLSAIASTITKPLLAAQPPQSFLTLRPRARRGRRRSHPRPAGTRLQPRRRAPRDGAARRALGLIWTAYALRLRVSCGSSAMPLRTSLQFAVFACVHTAHTRHQQRPRRAVALSGWDHT